MTAVPMCPGCRAILEPGAPVCPYCGWEIDRTRVRREGGLVERALRPFGGVVPVILYLNVLAYLATSLLGARALRDASREGGGILGFLLAAAMSPSAGVLEDLGAHLPEFVLERGEVWRLLCPVFLHGGLLHIFMNMSALRSIGSAVEEAYGSGKALAVYLLAGIAGNLAGVAWFLVTGPLVEMRAGPGGPEPVHVFVPRIGASGAIIGFAGVLAALGFRIGGEAGKALWKPMVKAVGFILVLGLVLSLTGSPIRIDNEAHLGGLLFGLGAGWLGAFGIRARGNPAAVRAWDLAAIALSLLYAASFVPVALGLLRG
jgi:rhomboid protease GluP